MQNVRPLRFGILGAARIAPEAIVKPAIDLPEVEISAIAARDPARAKEFAAAHRINRVLNSYQELVSDPAIDAVYNPLPNSLHYQWTIRALEAGKHVLCEKPIASNAEEAARMADAAKRSGRLLGEAFHYYYHPLAARVREIMRSGVLGRLLELEAQFSLALSPNNIRFDWTLAGGATMDLGCYALHWLRYFSGENLRVVSANAVTGPPKIDVTMEAILESESGASARMFCSMASDAQLRASFQARGEKGELTVVNPIAPQLGHSLKLRIGDDEKRETVPGETTYRCQLRAFTAAVRGRGDFPTDAEQGTGNMRTIDAVYRACRLPPRGA
jgi:predicted dehydrogenase